MRKPTLDAESRFRRKLALRPPDVCAPGSAEATFVSDISRNVTLGNEIISLTTTMLVSALAVDAIIKAGADQLFDTEANTLSG